MEYKYDKILSNEEYIEINPESDIRIKGLLEVICKDFDNGYIPSEIAANYLNLLLFYLNDYLNDDKSYSDITTAALDILHRYPVHKISVNLLSDILEYNVNYIIRCFKKDIGVTPHRYISSIKINMAIAYINQGHTCGEISGLLGFGSIAAFSYFLKSETGKNYSEIRRAVFDVKSNNSMFYTE